MGPCVAVTFVIEWQILGGKNDGCSKFLKQKFENAFARRVWRWKYWNFGFMKQLFNNVKEFFSECQSSLPQVMSSELCLPG